MSNANAAMESSAVHALPGIPVVLPAGVSTHMTIGAVLISTWCSVFTFSVICSATYVYYSAYPYDRMLFKSLVAFCFGLTIADTIASAVWAYDWLVKLFGSIPGAGIIPPAFYVNIFCCATATTTVQCFYAWRIWLLSRKNYILAGVIVFCSLTQQVVAMWVIGLWGSRHALVRDIGIVQPGSYVWLTASVLGDLLITGSLFYYLRVQSHSDDGHQSAEMVLNVETIVSRMVQANMASLLSQVATVVLFNLKVGMFFFLNDVTLTKIYVFSLLVSLNARRSKHAFLQIPGGSKPRHKHTGSTIPVSTSMPRWTVPKPAETEADGVQSSGPIEIRGEVRRSDISWDDEHRDNGKKHPQFIVTI